MSWDSSYATNEGQWRGDDHYTIDYSYFYTNTTDAGEPRIPCDVASASSIIVTSTLQPYCSTLLGYTTPVSTSTTMVFSTVPSLTVTSTTTPLTTVTTTTVKTVAPTTNANANSVNKRDTSVLASNGTLELGLDGNPITLARRVVSGTSGDGPLDAFSGTY